MNAKSPRYPAPKRIFDLVFSLLALIILSPVLALLVLILLLFQGPPLFFTQERPGLGGKIFRLVKFRSTYANGTAQTESLSLAWEDGAWKVVGVVVFD